MTLEGYWQCESVRHFSTVVRGTHGSYTVEVRDYGDRTDEGYNCTCDAFKFGKPYRYGAFLFKPECKHIREVKKLGKKVRCNWMQFMDGGVPVVKMGSHGQNEFYCPHCGKTVESELWAV